MRIVVDTNVVISGIFFGGNPRKIVEAIADGGIDAYGAYKSSIKLISENYRLLYSLTGWESYN